MVKCFLCKNEGICFNYECRECIRFRCEIRNIVTLGRVPEALNVRVTYHVIEVTHDGNCDSQEEGYEIYNVSEKRVEIDLPFPERIRNLIDSTPSEVAGDSNEIFEETEISGIGIDEVEVIRRKEPSRGGLALNPLFRNFYKTSDLRDHDEYCQGGIDYIPVDAVLL